MIKKILLLAAACLLLANTGVYCADSKDQAYLKVDKVVASSFDTTPDWAPLPNAAALVDGDLSTRWASNYTDEQWVTFDFGAPKVFDKIVIFWEAAYAPEYDILISQDNQAWQNLVSLKDQHGKINEIPVANTKARYVKILGVKRANPDWGISIWEVAFFGPAKDNPQDKPLAAVYPDLVSALSKEGSPAQAKAEESVEEPVCSPGALSGEEFQKGVVYTSWVRDELGSAASDKMLQHLKDIGIKSLGVMVVWYQDDVDSKVIYRDPKDTPSDQALAHVINKAHSLGMKVMLKPHVDIKTNQWRGDIIPSQEWFVSYKDYILYYAKLASRYNVELFSIGTELLNVTTSQWQNEWKDIIQQMRKEFCGKLTYSANWNEYNDVGFWNDLDFVGIDAYFALTDKKDPTKEELISGWKSNAEIIDKWLKKNKITKPVIYTELGYCSADGTNMQPWNVLTNSTGAVVDQQEQADALDAMLVVSTAYPWFKGFYWWNYFPTVRYSPLGYTINEKKAEEVMAEWLKKI